MGTSKVIDNRLCVIAAAVVNNDYFKVLTGFR